MSPLLFGLIGTEIKLNLIKMELIGLGFIVLLFSLFVSIQYAANVYVPLFRKR